MATPRVTRSRGATPLPAIPVKQSHSYGADGKARLKAQMRQSSQGVGEAFESARQASAAPEPSVVAEEDDEEGQSPPKNDRRGQRGSRQPSQSAAPERRAAKRAPPPAPPGGTIPERMATALDAGARYGGANGDDAAEVYQPSRTRVFARTLPRYIRALVQIANPGLKDYLFLIFGFISFLLLWSYAPLPAAMASTRDDICWGLKRVFRIHPYDVPHTELEEDWYRFKHDRIFSRALPTYNVPDMQWSININFLERIERMEAKIQAVEGDMNLHHETMTMIQEMLPPHVVVRVVDGRHEIPEAFWQALQERLGEEGDMAPLWKSYIGRNEREIEELNKQLVSLSLDRAMENRHILTREQFAQEMADNINWLENHYREDVRAMQQEHFEDVKEVAARTASDILAKSPSGQFAKEQLHKLVAATEVKNVYESLRATNWFSIGLGARIDPSLTSPTKKRPSKSWGESLYRLISPLIMAPRRPIVALQRWDEATECWCASLSDNGAAQITVRIVKKIYPHKLIVEHIPQLGTMDIKAAPQDIEIWAETSSKKEARTIAKAIEEDTKKSSYFKQKCGPPPTPYHVCIGQGHYDIHLPNWVQGFHLIAGDEMGIRSDRFTVKVTSNWGGDHTCFYRLRMMGEPTSSE